MTSPTAERRVRGSAVVLFSTLLVACAPRGASSVRSPEAPLAPPVVTVSLSDAATGRAIDTAQLGEGEHVVLTWTNSLFRLPVTQVFVARQGRLELTSIEYGDPTGKPPPRVRPEDAAELVQTGGPFLAEGLHEPVQEVVFRVGEIGDPILTLGGKSIRFLDEVGFGGAVRLVAR